MNSYGLALWCGQYDINFAWWREIALDYVRRGSARSLMPGARFYSHVMLSNVGEAEEWCLWSRIFYISRYRSRESQDWCLWSCNFYISSYSSRVSQDWCLWRTLFYISSYGSWVSDEMGEGQSYWTPEALWRPYLLLLFIVILLLLILLSIMFIRFVVNTGNSIPAAFLWLSSVVVSLHVTFSFRWFGPETIEHDLVYSIIDLAVSGTGNANQVRGHPYSLNINYDHVGLILTDNFVRYSTQPIGKQTHGFGFQAGAPAKEQLISPIGHPVAVESR